MKYKLKYVLRVMNKWTKVNVFPVTNAKRLKSHSSIKHEESELKLCYRNASQVINARAERNVPWSMDFTRT